MASLQTFKRSYAEILKGEDPWMPLGIFIQQFFGSRKHLRTELMRDPYECQSDIPLNSFNGLSFVLPPLNTSVADTILTSHSV